MGIGANNLTSKHILTDPVLFLAFGFGAGLAKKAPGTFGTLGAPPVSLVYMHGNFVVYTLATVLVILSGIWICGSAAKKLGEHDFSGIVWDEIAGFLVTMWLVPFSWPTVIIGFILFRVFDVFKPWPINWIDSKVHNGLGIMLDDLIAGLFAGVILVLIF